MAGTTWPNLVAGTPARAADVEAKFDWLEGNLDPMLAGTKANNTYDLGTSSFTWRRGYFGTSVIISNTGRLHLDGGADDDSYLHQLADDVYTFFMGGLFAELTIDGVAHGTVIRATSKLFWDGASGVGGDSYTVESSANVVDHFTGNVRRIRVTGSGSDTTITIGVGGTGGTLANITLDGGSAAAGGSYINFSRNSVITHAIGNESVILGTANNNFIINAGSGLGFKVYLNATQGLHVDNLTNIVPGSAALATSATDGFVYIQGCAGKPTGTPTTFTGRVPTIVDTSNNIPYFYANGAWRPMGGIFGVKARVATSTTLTATQTAITFGGIGRVRRLYFRVPGGASASVTSSLFIDGTSIFSSTGPSAVTSPTDQIFMVVNNQANTGASLLRQFVPTTTTETEINANSNLDLSFQNSVTVFFNAPTAGQTVTCYLEYEQS